MDNEPATPLHEAMNQVKDVVEESELLGVFNSPVPLDSYEIRDENSLQGFMEV